MQKFSFLLIITSLFFHNCKDNETHLDLEKMNQKDSYYSEQYRPQFHFSPAEKWMNDPNGLVYNNGTYHMFYQYYPDSIVWGPMHWGHAVSKNLLKWEHKPVALYPDSLGYIFSGSAVMDKQNTSGLGTFENPPMVAIFTYHLIDGETAGRNNFQYQGIAYSTDNGENWKKFKGNPVIENKDNIRDFRDPKVFWHEETKKWIMVLVAGDHAKIYNSSDLKSWNLLSEFGKNFGAHGGVWECPDLFKLPVKETDEERWVLIISINPGAPNSGSGTQYFIGNFDGKTFTPDHLDTRWLDFGTDNYAGITFNQTPDDQRIFIGWMSNWQYAQATPTEAWRSAMTVPRKLSLYKDGAEVKLKNYPLDNFKELYSDETVDVPSSLDNPILLKTDKRKGADIIFQADLNKPLSLRLSNKSGDYTTFSINPEEEILTLDRAKSGNVNFGEGFADKPQTQPYVASEQMVEIRILVDASSIEIFVDKGKYVFTAQVFPYTTYSVLNIEADNPESVKDLEINLINSIWTDEE